jgi:sec-independent protein translocase protein TatA
MGLENPVHILFVAVIALVVLGPRRLPELARAVGKGVREFREAVGGVTPERSPVEPAVPAAPPPVAGEAPAPPAAGATTPPQPPAS